MSDVGIKGLESTRRLNSEYQVMASISGTVLDRSITLGQIVQPAEIAFMVADLSQVWLIADVPEQEAGDLRAGKEVEARIAAFPGERISGHLAFVGATVNPETRTVRVRMNLANPQGRFKPAMLATMTVGGRTAVRPTIPVTAVVREEGKDNVFVQTGADTFTLRQVNLGEEVGELRIVLDGIEDDETLVLDGAFHLNNERKRLALGGSAS